MGSDRKWACTLIVGCGNIGNLIALNLRSANHHVIGIRRNIEYLVHGVEAIGADICNPNTLPEIEDSIDHFIFCPSAKSKDPKVYKRLYVDGLKHALNCLKKPPKRIWIVSSTGVYSETKGEWITERTPVNITSAKQQHLVDMESIAQQHAQTTVFRLSGLYGLRQQHLFKWITHGECPLPMDHWSNRIHNEDAASCMAQLIQKNINTPYVLISDGNPLIMGELITSLCSPLKQPLPSFSPASGNVNKRISNETLRSLLPTFQFKCSTEVYFRNAHLHNALQTLTAFQQSVLWHTYDIPWGKVMTYGSLAKWIGSPGASRAVGQALAINPCSPEMPCHRVIKSDRSLHGFSSSTDNHSLRSKFQHLQKEGVEMNQSKNRVSAYTVNAQHLFNPSPLP